jgi:ABC-type phosphate transport system permease subunit
MDLTGQQLYKKQNYAQNLKKNMFGKKTRCQTNFSEGMYTLSSVVDIAHSDVTKKCVGVGALKQIKISLAFPNYILNVFVLSVSGSVTPHSSIAA